jgi:glycerol-3-phosphate dehydrogenase
MAALEDQFPFLQLTLDDITATFSGVRPVIASGEANPSRENRDHAVWKEKGLLTVAGGKLTTFRLMVTDALKEIVSREPERSGPLRIFAPTEDNEASLQQVGETVRRRLLGRHGADAQLMIDMARPGELETIPA